MMDADGPIVSNTSWPQARKHHRCCECGGLINPGERYEHVKGIWPDGPQTIKTCSDCAALRAEVTPDEWEYGGLWDALDGGLYTDGKARFKAIQAMRSRPTVEIAHL